MPLAMLLALLATAAPTPPCSSPAHRQLDFWVGDWNVTDPAGTLVGINTITLEYGGCVVVEHWRSVRGRSRGSSFNVYEPATGQWHQAWVDTSGLYLRMAGSLRDGAMVLVGDVPAEGGQVVKNHLTLTPLPDGRVRQLWRQSTDGGTTWTVAFEGLYAKP